VGNEKLGKVNARRPKIMEGYYSDVLSEHIVTFSKRHYRLEFYSKGIEFC